MRWRLSGDNEDFMSGILMEEKKLIDEKFKEEKEKKRFHKFPSLS